MSVNEGAKGQPVLEAVKEGGRCEREVCEGCLRGWCVRGV